MFRNPVTRAILLSSGSIPVQRGATVDVTAKPDETKNDGSDSSLANGAKDVHLSLFRETFQAFDVGEVIGLFPEGTSYTEPEIVQVKDGAARVALEYARWQLQHASSHGAYHDKPDGTKKLAIVPVGIVYTDKSHYQSRVRVEFGEPINVDAYTRSYLAAAGAQESRSVVRNLTAEIERRLRRLTINAPNWDTWFAARICRDIVWGGDSRIPIQAYTEISQSYIERVSAANMQQSARDTLIKYYALLQRTGITHDTLTSVLPSQPSNAVDPIPTRLTTFCLFLRHLLSTVLHPSSILFIPSLVLHIPAYVAAGLGGHFLATPDEEETKAQFKAVCGGVVYGATAAVAGLKLTKALSDSSYVRCLLSSLPFGIHFERHETIGSVLGTAAVVYLTIWGIFGWYNKLVYGNYTRYTKLKASWKLLLGIFSPVSRDVSEEALEPYTRAMLPAPNPYIKRKPVEEPNSTISGEQKTSSTAAVQTKKTTRPPVACHRLIRHLLRARARAEETVKELALDRK
ncbi:hypothetical protein NM688_g7547 [Phlebia brevispora]|uniref:Uncharacterized protein n=1 Tax=Phlebia brevispora TaxID=194682 RepID=A0ACC1S3Z7_9APHY|nr:hypothetical protein NM688_g7547 [Phlebia brevispora]